MDLGRQRLCFPRIWIVMGREFSEESGFFALKDMFFVGRKRFTYWKFQAGKKECEHCVCMCTLHPEYSVCVPHQEHCVCMCIHAPQSIVFTYGYTLVQFLYMCIHFQRAFCMHVCVHVYTHTHIPEHTRTYQNVV